MTTRSKDELFQILSNNRRRYVIYYLHEAGESMSLKNLARKIAAAEAEVPESEIDADERQRVYISLYQTHLPKLEEAGIVVYDEDERMVQLTEATLDEGFFWMRRDDEADSSWLRYYAALSSLSWLLVVGVALALPLFTTLDWMGTALVVSVGLLVLVVGQYLDERRADGADTDDYETLVE